ncbi:MAG: cyclic nucleotide-binding domain-containing protein, partial [Thiogranum sp.]
MVSIDLLKGLPFFRGLRRGVLQTLANSAKVVELENNALVVHQHDRAIALYLLLSGSVQFLIEVEGSGKLLVGVANEPGLIIGWSVFRAPYRYMTDVRCEGSCRLLRIPHHVIDALMDDDPVSGLALLRRVNQSLAIRLEMERERLLESVGPRPAESAVLPDPVPVQDVPWKAGQLGSPEVMVDFLAHSSLFEGTERHLLDWLAHQAVLKTFARNDELFRQDDIAENLYLLVDGRVGLSYCDEGGGRCVFLRALEGIGDSIGWSSMVDPRRYRISAVALDLTNVVALPSDTLERMYDQEPVFGVRVMR